MNRSVNKGTFIAWSGLFLYFIGASLKSEGINESWDIYEYLPIVQELKNLSIVFISIGFTLMLLWVLFNTTVKKRYFSVPAFLYVFFLATYFIRAWLQLPGETKFGLAVGLHFFFFFFFWALLSHSEDKHRFYSSAFMLLSIWATIYTLLNLASHLQGVGFLPSVNRFLGVTSHPNFLGVAAAQCCLIFVFSAYLWKRRRYVKYALYFLATASFAMLIESKSRTGLVVLLFGLAATVVFDTNIHKGMRTGLLFISTLAIGILFLTATLVLNVDYYLDLLRLTSEHDTRSVVWANMYRTFLDHPFIGSGHTTGASESSYLRVLASGGILFGAIFMAALFACTKRIYKIFRSSKRSGSWDFVYFATAFCTALLAGAVTEGYLIESAGIWPPFLILNLFLIQDKFRVSAPAVSLRSGSLSAPRAAI